MCKRHRCTNKLNKCPKCVKFVSVLAPFTHAWTPEKNRSIVIILQCSVEHKNVFLHIPGLKMAQIKIPRNAVDDFGTITIWRHTKISSIKRKDQASFGRCKWTTNQWNQLYQYDEKYVINGPLTSEFLHLLVVHL
jgi:hypothetical protein